ncbi:MAG: hypothetical protein ACTFAL_14280 [Candidatus Electronema sp. V4]|uniref:hypothetical protein n=1 Tax=Candidatus Electronema sp. V4 TaxID=3454756 RepID=UPI00405572AC
MLNKGRRSNSYRSLFSGCFSPQEEKMSNETMFISGKHVGAVFSLLAALSAAPACMAGSYISATETAPDKVTHPKGYTGSGGVVNLEVCIATTSGSQAEMAQSVQNMIAAYNKLRPTTGNVWFDWASSGGIMPDNSFDFESVMLHELGHCLGMGHVNLASQAGLDNSQENYTTAAKGANAVFDLNAGADGIIGSGDDQRGDDVNLNWFRISNNNPFTIGQTVDSTTYARDLSSLPSGHSFAANGDRALSVPLLNSNDAMKTQTETVLQQGQYNNEVQRSLAAEDVATLHYAMSGLDRLSGTVDDYIINLTYGGIKDSCAINITTDAATGFAACSAAWTSISGGNGQHSRLVGSDIKVAPTSAISWHFNTAAPCSAVKALTANTWQMISLPCQVGISTGSKVSDVFGDDFSAGTYGSTWILYSRDEASNTYTQLTADSDLEEGVGYWIYTTETGKTADVEGQHSAQIDVPLTAGKWNMVGHPFKNAVNWADVRIIKEDTGEIKTLADVDPMIGSDRACDIDHASCIMSRVMYKWNGNAYTPYDGVTPTMTGTLEAGDGFWVKVVQPGYALRIPRP